MGCLKIVFPSKSGDFNHLHEMLEKEFTKLKTQNGAFELLRAESGGISRPLKLLSMPSNGYSMLYLKNLVGVSTVIYICPMKSSISREKLPQVVTASSPFTECPKCENLIPIFSLRPHVSICLATEIEVDDDTDKDVEVPVFDTKSISSVEKSDQQEDVKSKNECSAAKQCQASTSKGTSVIDNGVVTLLKIFPDHDTETVRRASVPHERIDLAADALSTSSN